MSRSGVYWWILVEARTLRIRHPFRVPFLFNCSSGEGTHSGAPLPCFYVYGLVLQPSELLLGRRIQKRGLFWGNRVPDVAVLNEEK